MIGENELCVECAKIGVQSRIRKYNINFEDKVSLCENKMCLFPFEIPKLCNTSTKDSQNLLYGKCVNNVVDFNVIDSLLDTPINEEDQLSNLMTLLNDNASQNTQLPATAIISLPESSAAQHNVPGKLMTQHTHVDKNSKPCIQRVYSKQKLAKEKPSRKCANIKSVKNSAELVKKPIENPRIGFGPFANEKASTRSSQQKNRANFKKFQIEQNNIFSFLNVNLSATRKKPKPAKSKASKKSKVPIQQVDVGSNHLVRHWLNKESPRRAFPGYGVKTVAGTSDGRSVIESIPPSPASLC